MPSARMMIVIATITGALLALLPWPTPVRIVEAEDQCADNWLVDRTEYGLVCLIEYGPAEDRQ